MSIPKNITKEHILKAIEKIDEEGIPGNAHSSTYDVEFNGIRYPPKLVLSYANIFANDFELDRSTFEGGKDTPCFNIIEHNGFKIVNKEAFFFPQLLQYLSQSETSNLKTKSFNKSYRDLKVEVSFGQGNKTWVPWMAFLRQGQSVSNGIYPVFLNYIKNDVLILAYGLSDTINPQNSWSLPTSVKTIHQYFLEKFNQKPSRYGDSFVYKCYFLDKNKSNFGLSQIEVEEDISNIIKIYKNLELKKMTSGSSSQHSIFPFNKEQSKRQMNLEYFQFQVHSKEAGLNFSDNLVVRFISSLCTKPFVILTGLAGSGKTKLAQAFSKWISEDESQVCIVPVGADWTNREPLLGFPNALDSTKYSNPENGALNLLIKADANPDKPYFLILDEMNLSHVERYFADFLSAMESHEHIPLHAEDGIENIPQSILLPKNLFIIGTVNIDETTYMFSPKVLDRANAIEFRVTHGEMEAFLGTPAKLNLNMLKARGANMAEDFVSKAKAEVNGFKDAETLNSALLSFFRELRKVGSEFGYRTASEIKRFAEVVHTLDTSWSTEQIIDAAIMQKLLPKIHGSRRKIEPSLKALASLCLVKQEDIVKVMSNMGEVNLSDAARVKYPLSLEKISRMYKAVVQDGFTSFAEA